MSIAWNYYVAYQHQGNSWTFFAYVQRFLRINYSAHENYFHLGIPVLYIVVECLCEISLADG